MKLYVLLVILTFNSENSLFSKVLVIDERAMCYSYLLDVSHYKRKYFFKKVIFEYESLNILDENVCI